MKNKFTIQYISCTPRWKKNNLHIVTYGKTIKNKMKYKEKNLRKIEVTENKT